MKTAIEVKNNTTNHVLNFLPVDIHSKTADLVRILIDSSLSEFLTWDRNVIRTINLAIEKIDEKISEQLSQVFHHDKFKKLEGSWRGLNYLASRTDTSSELKIKVLNTSKIEIGKDLSKSADFDQTQLFKMIYEREFGTPGGEPFSILIGDYQFDNSIQDIEFLTQMAGISAAAFCPFISSANPALFGLSSFQNLSKPRDLEKNFESQEYIKWNALREKEDARFIVLTAPRVLARLPYGSHSKPVHEFNFEEHSHSINEKQKILLHEDHCWMNSAYALAERITHAFSKFKWCTAIRGAESGGKISDLPLYTFISEEGDLDYTCPTETGITDRREAELSRLGFLPLCHYKNTDYAVFFGAQTLQKPPKFDKPEATANALISTRLPYVMATSRFAHYVKVIARDKIGSFMDVATLETTLNAWIMNYVNANTDSGSDMKAKYPLAEAKVQVTSTPGMPGAYHAIVWLKPWLQLEELTASLRLVANIPKAL